MNTVIGPWAGNKWAACSITFFNFCKWSGFSTKLAGLLRKPTSCLATVVLIAVPLSAFIPRFKARANEQFYESGRPELGQVETGSVAGSPFTRGAAGPSVS